MTEIPPEGPFGGHPAQASAPGEPPALDQITFSGSRSITASRDGVVLPVGKIDVGRWFPPLNQHREPCRQLGVPDSPLGTCSLSAHVSLVMAPILTQFPPHPLLLGDGCQKDDGLPGDSASPPHALPSLRVRGSISLSPDVRGLP